MIRRFIKKKVCIHKKCIISYLTTSITVLIGLLWLCNVIHVEEGGGEECTLHSSQIEAHPTPIFFNRYQSFLLLFLSCSHLRRNTSPDREQKLLKSSGILFTWHIAAYIDLLIV